MAGELLNQAPLSVRHFQRLPGPGQVSIERLFKEVRQHLPANITCTVHISPRLSQGVAGRLVNLRAAARCQEKINHVTGDVHYLALGLPARTTLLTVHDCVSLERLRGFKRAVFRWFWYSLPVARAALVSVISESTRRELLRHVKCDPAKVRVVPNCVSSDFLRRDKPFGERKPMILQVGTGVHKNLARGIEAVSGLSCHLRIIGRLSSEQRSILARHRIEFSNVESATHAEIATSYQQCDLVLFVSTYEGFGLPIVEANATGRPVVTSNLFSMPEVAGEAACLVDPFNVATIRAGIVRVIGDPAYRHSLVAAGFENVKRFEPRGIAAQYADLYSEIANNG
jgi:glycosyltransferase involved in cell wall biosynthesis